MRLKSPRNPTPCLAKGDLGQVASGKRDPEGYSKNGQLELKIEKNYFQILKYVSPGKGGKVLFKAF